MPCVKMLPGKAGIWFSGLNTLTLTMSSTNQPAWGVEGMRIRKRGTAFPGTHLSYLKGYHWCGCCCLWRSGSLLRPFDWIYSLWGDSRPPASDWSSVSGPMYCEGSIITEWTAPGFAVTLVCRWTILPGVGQSKLMYPLWIALSWLGSWEAWLPDGGT